MGWMSTLIPVTFLHVDINKMAWEEHLRKTIPQICQDYIFMRSPAQHPRRSLWWYKLMYILTGNFVCQRMPPSIVEMVSSRSFYGTERSLQTTKYTIRKAVTLIMTSDNYWITAQIEGRGRVFLSLFTEVFEVKLKWRYILTGCVLKIFCHCGAHGAKCRLFSLSVPFIQHKSQL